MRVSGRGGLCSVPGAGVWCDETVGVVCSGYGECFIRTLFAREMCEAVRENREAHVTEGLRRLEEDQQRMRISLPSCFGLLCCCREENRVRVILSHTSKMMGMGVFDGERIETRLSEQTGEECVYYERVLLGVCCFLFFLLFLFTFLLFPLLLTTLLHFLFTLLLHILPLLLLHILTLLTPRNSPLLHNKQNKKSEHYTQQKPQATNDTTHD